MSVLENAAQGKYDRKKTIDNASWVAELNRVNALLSDDLAAEFGLTDHPKKDMLFKMANNLSPDSRAKNVREMYEYLSELL